MSELIIYTHAGEIVYLVKETTEDFANDLAKALSEGPVTLDTVEGSVLFINPANVCALEIKNKPTDIPPGGKI